MSNTHEEAIGGLKTILAVVALVACIFAFILIGTLGFHKSIHETVFDLFYHFLPEAMVGLVAGVILYYLFATKGLSNDQFLIKAIASTFDEKLSALPSGSSSGEIGSRDVIRFFANYREVDWSGLLASANSVDIAVSYYDSWVKQNHEHVVELFKRGGTIRIIVSSPDDDLIMRLTAERFPEYDLNTIRLKVRNTGRRFQEALDESHTHSGRLEVYYFPHTLNYSAIRINNQSLLLSVYEHFRRQRIDSSATLLNLAASSHLREFWDKEFGGLIQASRRVNRPEIMRTSNGA